MTVLKQPLLESIQEIASALGPLPNERLFLVIDESAYEASGAKGVIEAFLKQKATERFTEFELNPKLEDVHRGIEAYRNFKPDFVIALGGGTTIDLAKLINSLAAQSGSPRDIALGQVLIEQAGVPMMAIPTTAGTGSEATHFAVVYVDGEKYSVAHPSLLPDYVIVDPKLTESLPKRLTAATGLDAFCQAIESIWAVAATQESIGYAKEAARLAFHNLAIATNAPTPAARRAMCRASHLAGKAINITKTTAPHALSYYLTSRYGVPHGMAVASTLASMLAFNARVTDDDCTDPRGACTVHERIAQILEILGSRNINDACSLIVKLLKQIECPTLEEFGVSDDFEAIVDSVNVQRLSNNPRRASREQLIEVLAQSYSPLRFRLGTKQELT